MNTHILIPIKDIEEKISIMENSKEFSQEDVQEWKHILAKYKQISLDEKGESEIIEAAKKHGMYGGYAMKDYTPFETGYKQALKDLL